jgi:hypothetical protein
MATFWIAIVVVVLIIVGVSVLVGSALSRPREPMSKHQRMMALKASGALKHRKSNRE